MTGTQAGTLGIIAGAGDLPIAIAQGMRAAGRSIFLIAIEGIVNRADVEAYPHAFVSMGELGKAIRLLKDAGCLEITMAGKIPRPEFKTLNLDARGTLALPRLMAAAMKGDDALLRAVLGIFESEGMRVLGSADTARELLAPLGALSICKPSADDEADIAHAATVVKAMGALDIGQAAVVCRGLVLAVEAAEGTDAMLARIASLPEALRGKAESRKGVLVKAVKPHQERRVDLPVIGVKTIELAAAGGLAGIAVEAGLALILNRGAVTEAANRLGLFIHGFAPKAGLRE